MNKIIKGLLLALMLTISLVGCSSVGDKKEDKENKELVIGMELAYPPFETTDEKGNPSGMSVDLAKDLGEYLGRTVRIENMAYAGLIPSLQSKKIDVILSSMTISEERLEVIDFSDAYSNAYLTLLINKDSPVNEVKDLNLKGRKVAIKKGTIAQVYAEKFLPEAEVLLFDKETACVLEVVQGKADAFIYDQMTIFKNWQQYPNETRANLTPFEEEPQEWAMGVRKEDKELKEQINAFIKEYKENGGFEKLSDKYLSDIKEEFKSRDIPFFF
ncbi:transporter substrate-binding domain-containing protein [Clostridium algidicarnis]|uniref:transporter substrate-binding domain-containing protein n=1 Tax=Clostridium algidicarnis TaxID=37659 RepID=UPI00162611FE|nr:transporter substrate-binding domain-containing protein [Clostridium algidicarnis]MBB6630753.1 transporter substrate-binding domain-containing protein [Clostridium algidicarnis]